MIRCYRASRADYLILRAVVRYHENLPPINPDGLTENDTDRLTDTQERYNVVMAHYLAGAISTGRTAELLSLPWIELRERFRRLDVSIRLGSNFVEEACQELNSLLEHSMPGQGKWVTDPNIDLNKLVILDRNGISQYLFFHSSVPSRRNE